MPSHTVHVTTVHRWESGGPGTATEALRILVRRLLDAGIPCQIDGLTVYYTELNGDEVTVTYSDEAKTAQEVG